MAENVAENVAGYSDQERQTIRTAAFGAVFLVSNADPGMFAAVKESYAGSKVLAGAQPWLRDLLKSGGLPKVPKGSPAEVETAVLAALKAAVGIIQAKASPQEVDGFRSAVVSASEQVAAASDGTKETEQAAVDKIKAAVA